MGNSAEARVVTFRFGGNKEIERGVLSGAVQATIRLRREVEPGGVARAHTLGLDLIIDRVVPGTVTSLLQQWHKRLGFSTYEAALEEWISTHPRAGTDRIVYLYFFHHSPYPLGRNRARIHLRTQAPIAFHAPAYELLADDKSGSEELLAVLVCDHLDVTDDESRAQAENFLQRRLGDEAVGRWLQGGARTRMAGM